MPPKKKRESEVQKGDDEFVDDGGEPAGKRSKTSASGMKGEIGKKMVDEDGNPFWEIGGRLRRVAVSKYQGKHLLSIREHYEKDGKVLPGKKGISLTIDQFNSVLAILPQIDQYLSEEGVSVARPQYKGRQAATAGKNKGAEEGEGEEEEINQEEEEAEAEEKVKEEEEEDEEEVQKPKPKAKAKAKRGRKN